MPAPCVRYIAAFYKGPVLSLRASHITKLYASRALRTCSPCCLWSLATWLCCQSIQPHATSLKVGSNCSCWAIGLMPYARLVCAECGVLTFIVHNWNNNRSSSIDALLTLKNPSLHNIRLSVCLSVCLCLCLSLSLKIH